MKQQSQPLLKRYSLFIVAILLAVACMSVLEANAMNKQTEKFRFENYKTAEEAQAALLNLHPVGSKTPALMKRLESLALAGTLNEVGSAWTQASKYQYQLKTDKKIIYAYRQEYSSLDVQVKWIVEIQNNNGHIGSIKISRYLTGT